ALPSGKAAERASGSLATPRATAVRGCDGSRSAGAPARARESFAATAPGLPYGCDSRARIGRSAVAGTRGSHLLRRRCAPTRRVRVCVPASDFFSNDFGQYVLVERQISNQPLQLRVLLAQLSQLAQLRRPQVRVLLLPDVERRLADAHLAADIGHRRATLRLPQRIGDLLVRVPRALHRPLLLSAPTGLSGGLPEATLVQF